MWLRMIELLQIEPVRIAKEIERDSGVSIKYGRLRVMKRIKCHESNDEMQTGWMPTASPIIPNAPIRAGP